MAVPFAGQEILGKKCWGSQIFHSIANSLLQLAKFTSISDGQNKIIYYSTNIYFESTFLLNFISKLITDI